MRSSRDCGPRRTALCLGMLLACAPAATAAAADDAEVARLRAELAATRGALTSTQDELQATRDALAALERRVDGLQAAAPATPVPTPQGTARLAPVNVDNPAISFVVDVTGASATHASDGSIGFPNGTGFALRTGELFISAPIDPFLRGYASLSGSSSQGFDIEEAALVTTALPWNLTVKGGRFFADVGRFPHWHDEALPFVDRPPSIDRLIGGESKAEGAEVSWLAPLEQYVDITGGVYNTVGAENTDGVNRNGFFGRRSFNELTYLVHPHGYLDLTDSWNTEIGATWLASPQAGERTLYALDFTLRHQPGTSGFYQGLVWGTEWLWNNQRFTERDDAGGIVDRSRFQRQGGYSYLEAFFGRRYSAGLRFDYSEALQGLVDRERMASLFVTWMPSEFHRLRLQVDHAWGDQPSNQRFTLQWTAFIGSHSHGFSQR